MLFVENYLIFQKDKTYSISTEGQHEPQTITQARSDKKLVRTEGRNAPCCRPRMWLSWVNPKASELTFVICVRDK